MATTICATIIKFHQVSNWSAHCFKLDTSKGWKVHLKRTKSSITYKICQWYLWPNHLIWFNIDYKRHYTKGWLLFPIFLYLLNNCFHYQNFSIFKSLLTIPISHQEKTRYKYNLLSDFMGKNQCCSQWQQNVLRLQKMHQDLKNTMIWFQFQRLPWAFFFNSISHGDESE